MPLRNILIADLPLARAFHPILKFLTTVPKEVKEANYWFYNISNLAYVLIALLHFSWMIVFFNYHIPIMMRIQVVSVLCYAIAVAFNRKGYHLLGMLIGIAETNLHQVFAVSLLGWSSGFQNFLPLISLLPFLKYNETFVTKLLFGVGCMLCYLYMDFFMKGLSPVYILPVYEINFFNFSNAILCFVLAALWGIVLALSYQKTVSALLKKEQELFEMRKSAEQAEILAQLEMTERDNEISQLRNVELHHSNNEILTQKKIIEALVTEQEQTISERTAELGIANAKLIDANKKLVELIQYNAHNLREPLARVLGGMAIHEYMAEDEFYKDVWPEIARAAGDLDTLIRSVINVADEAITRYS